MKRLVSRLEGGAGPKRAPRKALPVFAALCLAAGAALFSGCDTGTGGGPAPDVPANVVAAPTFGQIDVTWTASSGAGWYTVYYYKTGSPQSGVQTLNTATTGAVIKDLSDDTDYSIRIKAGSGGGTSDFSDAVTAKTSKVLPSAFDNSKWYSTYGDSYTIVDHGTAAPAAERWELAYEDWASTTGGSGSYGFKGFIKYFAAQTPSTGESDAGVIILKYHDEGNAPLGAWDYSGPPPEHGLFGAVYYHTLKPGISAAMGAASNLSGVGSYNVEEPTLKAAVDKFGPAGSIDEYQNTSYSSVYNYTGL